MLEDKRNYLKRRKSQSAEYVPEFNIYSSFSSQLNNIIKYFNVQALCEISKALKFNLKQSKYQGKANSWENEHICAVHEISLGEIHVSLATCLLFLSSLS